MQSPVKKWKLNSNHRRFLSVTLRELEQMCDGVDEWTQKKSGLMYRVVEDLTPVQIGHLRSLTAETRAEIRRLGAELDVPGRERSRKGMIRALLSVKWADLEDGKSANLRGYGELSDDAARRLDAEMDRLIALVEKMIQIVERGESGRETT